MSSSEKRPDPSREEIKQPGDEPRNITGWLWAWVQRPETVTDLLQITKAVVAATAAWAISVAFLGSDMPFLAPWTALLTVHATVYRSFSRGVQTTVSSTIGVILSFVIGHFLGVSLWTFALALLIGMVLSRFRWIRDEGIAIATTAIFVLGDDYASQELLLMNRIVEVGLGVALGVIVNLLILPPLRDRQASRYVDSTNRRIGGVLVSMADEFDTSWDTEKAEDWLTEIDSITDELDSAWQDIHFARESEIANLRRRRQNKQRHGDQHHQDKDQRTVPYEEILSRAGEGVSHLRNLTRTLLESSYEDGPWDDHFREEWAAIVRDTGLSIADPTAPVEPFYDRLNQLAEDMADDDQLPRRTWPLYGALLTGVRHIVIVVDDVVSSRDARQVSGTTEA